MTVSGFAAGFINPVLGAVIFERIPEPLVGRVSSLSTAMCFALIPFGGLVGGVLMVMPGLVTDLIGAVLVVPPTRRLLARWAQSTLARRLTPSAATSLFGPRTVRVRTGAPHQAPPSEPTSGVADPPRGTTQSPLDPIEGEIIDPR